MSRFFFTFLIILQFNFLLLSQELPQPKNNQLYTEFTSYRYAAYLKKPLIGSGYIAMDGMDKFIFKQNEPARIVVKKSNGKIIYKRENADAIEISDESNEILIIFGDQKNLSQNYEIKKDIQDGKDKFLIIPKKNDNMKSMVIIAINDIVERLEINFKDDSKLVYEFRNSVTGRKPDEKLFE